MNQGTFSDYHWGGDFVLEKSTFDLVTGGEYTVSVDYGLYIEGHSCPSLNWELGKCSRLSWFSTLSTCKIIIMLQLLQLRMVWLMSMVAILIRIL